MKRLKYILFYIIAVGGILLLILFMLNKGEVLEAGKLKNPAPVANAHYIDVFIASIKDNLAQPFAGFLLQLILIVFSTRLAGFIFKKFGQPSVVGEILAGIILGPSLLGAFFPNYLAYVFPASAMDELHLFSRLGLILFMFVVGMELNWEQIRSRAREAVVISHAGIIFPFALGVICSLFVYSSYAPDNIRFVPFSLFMGIAMSITAFPVLASILRERKMSKSIIGSLVITCAAIDDITAWCVFAAVIAISSAGTYLSAFFTIGLTILYILAMFKLVRPLLEYYYNNAARFNKFGISPLTVAFVLILISSFVTKLIGIHSLFGAFMAGVIMPSPLLYRNYVSERTEHVSVILLLPIFFAYSGLRTQVGLLNSSAHWLTFGFILFVAVAGKLAGTALTARYLGQNWGNSLRIGVLMNTRGLMELVVINIGYEMGILSAEIFTMLVLMALATTFMTGPLLNIIDRVFKKDPAELNVTPDDNAVLPEFLAEKQKEVTVA